jgi:hypothetical protein
MRNVDSNEYLARRIKRKGPIFIRGYFPTAKNQNSLYFESYLELAALLRYENDPNIMFIDSQPMSVCLTIANRKTRYSPDLMLMDVMQNIKYVEVKPAEKLSKAKNKTKYDVIEEAFKKLGRQFTTFSNNDVTQARLKNLELLYQGASVYNNIAPELEGAISVLPNVVSIEEAIHHLSTAEVDRNVLHYLLFNSYFTVDLDIPISNDSIIYSNIA